MNFKNLILSFLILNSFNIKALVEEIDNLTYFKEKVLTESVAIVKFYTPWCGPCKRMKSVVESIERDYSKKLKVFEVDAGKHTSISSRYNISGVPVIVFLKDGVEVGRTVGALTAQALKNKIKEFLNI